MRLRFIGMFAAVVLLVVLGLLVVGCGASTTTTTVAPASSTTGAPTTTTAAPTTTTVAKAVEVKNGAAGPFTGQLSRIGIDTLKAVKFAVDEFNGSQTKIKVSVDAGDDAGDPAKAALAAEKLCADAAVMGVVGPMMSASVQTGLPIYEKNGLSIITPSATNDKLSQQGYTVFHRVTPVDLAQGAALAGLIAKDLTAKKVFIVGDKSTYGQGLADQVEKDLKTKYGVTDIQRTQVATEDKDFAAIITRVKAYAPDAFLACGPPGSVRRHRQADGADGREGAVGGHRQLQGPDRVRADDAGEINRKTVLDALATTNYTGVLGIPIQFQPNGDLKTSGVFIGLVKGGKFVQVKAADY